MRGQRQFSCKQQPLSSEIIDPVAQRQRLIADLHA